MQCIAERVIRKLGGAKVVARARGIDPSTVHRWKMPKARGGTGGLVPAEHQGPLLEFARAQGLPLEPSDFFDLPEGEAGELDAVAAG